MRKRGPCLLPDQVWQIGIGTDRERTDLNGLVTLKTAGERLKT